MLEEGRFAASDIRLVDEELAAGTLTEFAGEPAVIRAADDDSFEGVELAFFTGSAAFALHHANSVLRAGASVIDLSGGLADFPGARLWIPSLDIALQPPEPSEPSSNRVLISPSTPAIVACTISSALAPFKVERLTFVFFQPVSEAGQAGVEELENQTTKLLSFHPIGEEVFGTQVAFNLLDQYGPASSEKLHVVRERISRETCAYLNGRAVIPAIQLVHAPVFHSYGFTAYAELRGVPDAFAIGQTLQKAGIHVPGPDAPAASNLSVSGETKISINLPTRDPQVARGYWFWGAADNFRLTAANAVRIAEKLI